MSHTHKYELKAIGRNKDYFVYACVLPGCRHYIAQTLAYGKECVCWRCGTTTIIAKDRAGKRGRKHPVCFDCIRHKVKKEVGVQIDTSKLADMSLEDLFGSMHDGYLPEEE